MEASSREVTATPMTSQIVSKRGRSGGTHRARGGSATPPARALNVVTHLWECSSSRCWCFSGRIRDGFRRSQTRREASVLP